MAGDRKKVGLIFSYDERWIAGAYYIFNLVHALKTLPEEERPHLIICTNAVADYQKLLAETQYPFTSLWLMRRRDFFSKTRAFLNYRLKPLFGKDIIDVRPTQKIMPVVFPLTYTPPYYFEKIVNRIFWIPDFQEHFFPDFFSREELSKRKAYQQKLAQNNRTVVFSSHVAHHHYTQLYPDNISNNKVIQFAVTHTTVENDIKAVRSKYAIDREYFLCSNQFWMHKNHMSVLKALHLLKSKSRKIKVVFTGAAADLRNPEFYQSILAFAQDNDLNENALFLGLIPRAEQLCLLKNALAVIQPSLFEGWSTIVEDAKSMNQFIVASHIEVHQEQLADYPNYAFFNPEDPASLATQLERVAQGPVNRTAYNYQERIKQFGKNFIGIMEIKKEKTA